MTQNMFCFQCEQTAGCSGCTGKAGVCGKTAQTAELQDQLTGALITLAEEAEKISDCKRPDRLIMEGLFTTLTNVNFDDESIRRMTDQVWKQREDLTGISDIRQPHRLPAHS